MHEVMVSEVKKFHRCNASAFQTHSVIGGISVKQYRLARALGCETGLNRRRLGNTSDKSALRPRRQRNLSARTALMMKVVSFMERDDNNSSMMPGKADVAKIDGEHHQTRYLTTTLAELHTHFRKAGYLYHSSVASDPRIFFQCPILFATLACVKGIKR